MVAGDRLPAHILDEECIRWIAAQHQVRELASAGYDIGRNVSSQLILVVTRLVIVILIAISGIRELELLRELFFLNNESHLSRYRRD